MGCVTHANRRRSAATGWYGRYGVATIVSSIAFMSGCAGATPPTEDVSVPVPTVAPVAPAHTGATLRTRRTAEGNLLASLPAECPKARVYLNLESLFGTTASPLDAVIEKLLGGVTSSRDAKIVAAMQDTRLTASNVREVAMCAVENRPIVALRVNVSRLRSDLPDALGDVLLAADEPSKREPRGEVTYIVTDKTAIAVVDDVATMGAKREELADARMVGGAGHGFDDARGSALWFQSPEATGTVVVVRETLRLDLSMKPPQDYAERWAKDPDAAVLEMRTSLDELRKKVGATSFKFAAPLLENVTIERAQDRLHVTAAFPAASLADLLDGIAKLGLPALAQVFR